VLSKDKIPGLAGVPTLKTLNGAIILEDSAFAQGDTEWVTSTIPFDYTQVGNASCKGKSAVAPASASSNPAAAGALPAGLLLPLLLAGIARRRGTR
jgi:hypothetical protein